MIRYANHFAYIPKKTVIRQGDDRVIHALVCDDYEPIANLITAFLDGMGITVTTAGDGNQALDLVHSLRPDLIISDIDMPGMSGIELFTALRSDATGFCCK
jgi:CheY-like chemotaxis protein